MKTVGIVGYGEIGQSLEKCYLGKEFEIQVLDTGKNIYDLKCGIDVLNIAIPFYDQKSFVKDVSKIIEKYQPKLVIIHSTTIPGTTLSIAQKTKFKNIVHSPVRGVHPNLYEGLKTFVKFVGGDNKEAVDATIKHYDQINITYEVLSSSTATELAKVLSTTYYGVCIAFHNDINKLCDRYGVKYEEVGTKWNITYNEGYKNLGMKNVIRPVLYPPKNGKIGGHCVIQNAELCQQFFNSKALEYILELKEGNR
tara:strand:+ start:27808 stop:28563 length:756 start_codon:yes stop_codon:yes gene_type:complete